MQSHLFCTTFCIKVSDSRFFSPKNPILYLFLPLYFHTLLYITTILVPEQHFPSPTLPQFRHRFSPLFSGILRILPPIGIDIIPKGMYTVSKALRFTQMRTQIIFHFEAFLTIPVKQGGQNGIS